MSAAHPRRYAFIAPLILLAAVLASSTVHAQTYSIIHNFIGAGGDYPYDGVTMDRAGNMFVTASGGGEFGQGAVVKLSRVNGYWISTPIYSFRGGNDGAIPYSGLTIGPDGALYGTTSSGGQGAPTCNGGCGTVYKLSPPSHLCRMTLCPWTETILYKFYQNPEGLNYPWAGVTFDSAGNIYGTTLQGGAGGCALRGCGGVYKLTPSGSGWVATVIYSFTGHSDGSIPYAGVTLDAAGNVYGTTSYTAPDSGYGAVYELTPSGQGWTEKTLYDFTGGADGGSPEAGVIFDDAGNLYGGTAEANNNPIAGVVFELSPNGSGWNYSVLYTFPTTSLVANLTFDSAGNLYGTTPFGGQYLFGSVFKLTNNNGTWTQTDLHDFNRQGDGILPWSTVSIDAAGNLYGTTNGGGSGNGSGGTVWEIMP